MCKCKSGHYYLCHLDVKYIDHMYVSLNGIFSDFRSGKAPILVATDVAARGLGMFLNK